MKPNKPIKPKGPPPRMTDRNGLFDRYRGVGPSPIVIDGDGDGGCGTIDSFARGLMLGIFIGGFMVLATLTLWGVLT